MSTRKQKGLMARKRMCALAVGAALAGGASLTIAQESAQQQRQGAQQRQQAQQQQQRQQTRQQQARSQGAQQQPLDQFAFGDGRRMVIGEVTRVRDVMLSGPAGDRHRLLQVLANGNRVVVDLGPVDRRITVRPGDRIMALGNTARIDGRPVIYARYVAELYDSVPLGGPVTDLTRFTDVTSMTRQAQQLIGTGVQLENLYVTRVPSDKTFFVCSTQGQQAQQGQGAAAQRCSSEEALVVLLEEEGAPPADVEGRVDINAGQRITIPAGRVEQFNQASIAEFALTSEGRSLARDAGLFIVAERVNVTSRGGQQASAAAAGQQARQQNQAQSQARQSQSQQRATQSQQQGAQSQQQRRAQTQARGAQGQSQQSGNRARIVDLEQWDYDQLYRDGWSADRLMDADVLDENGDDIGSVENLLINEQGRLVAIIAQVGGFLDIGDTHIAVPWQQVSTAGDEEVMIPVTEENIQDYIDVNDDYFTQVDVGELQRVDDDLVTGPQIWKATDVLDDDVLLQDGTAYGYVSDLVFNRQGNLQSIVVSSSNPDYGYGYYAYPWYGPTFGAWQPGLGYYTLPYGAADIGGMTAFDYGAFDRGLF